MIDWLDWLGSFRVQKVTVDTPLRTEIPLDTLFKLVSGQLAFELEGSEEFVRSRMSFFLPLLRGTAEAAPPARAEPQEGSLPHWYRETVPPGQRPTMQEHILIFAYYLYRQQRQFIFAPDDMKASFAEMKRVIPKSLLQIMGSLKRDQGLLYPGKKRGEYSLTPEGIKYVEGILGIRKPTTEAKPPPEPRHPPPEPSRSEPVDRDSPQRDRFFSLFKDDGDQTEDDHDS